MQGAETSYVPRGLYGGRARLPALRLTILPTARLDPSTWLGVSRNLAITVDHSIQSACNRQHDVQVSAIMIS